MVRCILSSLESTSRLKDSVGLLTSCEAGERQNGVGVAAFSAVGE